jgi:hypothetical protein
LLRAAARKLFKQERLRQQAQEQQRAQEQQQQLRMRRQALRLEAKRKAEKTKLEQLRKQHRLRLRGGGGGEESIEDLATPEEAQTPPRKLVRRGSSGSVCSTDSGSQGVLKQFSLHRFFSPQSEQSQSPVLEGVNLGKKRGRPPSGRASELEAELQQLRKAFDFSLSDEDKNAIAVQRQKAALRVGFRGRKRSEHLKAVLGRSNRKVPGLKGDRVELSAATKLKFARELQLQCAEYATPDLFWRAMSQRYRRQARDLKDILARVSEWETLGRNTSRSKKGKHSRVRRSGAGRKRALSFVPELAIWLSTERSYGRSILPQDVGSQWCEFLAQHIENLQDEKAQLCPEDDASVRLSLEISQASARLLKFQESPQYRKCYQRRLLSWMGAKHMTPHLVTQLSALEEETRAKLTWQAFDSAQYLAAFGSESELAKYVASPLEFIANRRHCSFGYSDQVPVWVKVGSKKQVFAGAEVGSSMRKAKDSEGRSLGFPESSTTDLVQLKPKGPLGQRQLRSNGCSQDGQFRITYEASQILKN